MILTFFHPSITGPSYPFVRSQSRLRCVLSSVRRSSMRPRLSGRPFFRPSVRLFVRQSLRLSIHSFVCPSVSFERSSPVLSRVRPSVLPPVCPSVLPPRLSVLPFGLQSFRSYFARPSERPSVYLIRASVGPSVHPSVRPVSPSVLSLSIRPSVRPFRPYVYMRPFHPSVCPSVRLSVRPFVYSNSEAFTPNAGTSSLFTYGCYPHHPSGT